jgi:hypothetical protein
VHLTATTAHFQAANQHDSHELNPGCIATYALLHTELRLSDPYQYMGPLQWTLLT